MLTGCLFNLVYLTSHSEFEVGKFLFLIPKLISTVMTEIILASKKGVGKGQEALTLYDVSSNHCGTDLMKLLNVPERQS